MAITMHIHERGHTPILCTTDASVLRAKSIDEDRLRGSKRQLGRSSLRHVCLPRVCDLNLFLWRAQTSPPPASSPALNPLPCLPPSCHAGRAELCHVVSRLAGSEVQWVCRPPSSVWPSHQVQARPPARSRRDALTYNLTRTRHVVLTCCTHTPTPKPTHTHRQASSCRLSARVTLGVQRRLPVPLLSPHTPPSYTRRRHHTSTPSQAQQHRPRP